MQLQPRCFQLGLLRPFILTGEMSFVLGLSGMNACGRSCVPHSPVNWGTAAATHATSPLAGLHPFGIHSLTISTIVVLTPTFQIVLPVISSSESTNNENKRRTMTKRTNRDPNAPKRNMSAYLLYQNAMRDEFKSRNPDMSFGQVRQLAWLLLCVITVMLGVI